MYRELKRVLVWAALGLAILLWSAMIPVEAADAEKVVLTFDKETATIINARRWDETFVEWRDAEDAKDPLFFDGIHRFLFLRFPDCAKAIHAQMGKGYEIAKAELVLTWTRQEFVRCKGYSWRGWTVKGKPIPKSHVRVSLLRRPWADDPKIGPTWNAYINGAGYWRGGGARDNFADRYPTPLAKAELWNEKRTANADVTAALVSPEFGATSEQRLRQLADCGFRLQKDELWHRGYGNYGGWSPARIWIAKPKLVVTMRKAGEAMPLADLPPAVDVKALAEQLAVAGGDGAPTTVIPTNLKELIAQRQERWQAMPGWMRKRTRELLTLKTYAHDFFLHYTLFDDPAMADRETYLKTIQEILAIPPGYFLGHSHIDPVLVLLDCEPLLPDVVRYHLEKYIESRWQPPYDMKIFHHRVGYWGDMSTLNLQTQGRAESILAGERLGNSDLTIMARRALSLLNRQMVFSEGTIQERGDSFYLGITLGTLQGITRFSEDPMSRLKAGMGIEKMLLESNCTYHPGLRRRVSTIARRYRMNYLLMAQDVPRAILHTLSKKGVLIHTGESHVYGDPEAIAQFDAGTRFPRAEWPKLGIPVNYMNPCPPERVALLAPWGREWESNAIDNKPLPFECKSTFFWRSLIKDPIYFVNYMGHHYALASMHSSLPREWHNQAAWRRDTDDVEHLDDLGILFIWDYMNGKPMNPQKHEDSEGQGPKANPVFSILQHKNKMLYAMRPTERTFSWPFCRPHGGVKSIFSRVFIHNFDKKRPAKVFINGKWVESYPAAARHGDRITIHDGVTYLGLIPWAVADLPGMGVVKITREYPRLLLDSYVLETDKPMPDAPATWAKLMDTPAGWTVEMGDVTEYGSFEKFQQHFATAGVKSRVEAKAHTLHATYTSGTDTLAMGMKMDLDRKGIHYPIEPPDVVAYHRVNDKNPYPPAGIDLDSPLGQLGRAARLEKNGAVLETVAGQMAMLRVEPINKITEAVHPFIDPTPLRLTTPEGIVVKAEGPIGCCRITVLSKSRTLEVDYYLPAAEGALGVQRLQADARAGKHGGSPEWEAKLSTFFRPGVDVTRARQDSARTLLVTGFGGLPTVLLNGQPLNRPLTEWKIGGKTWYRVPVVAEPYVLEPTAGNPPTAPFFARRSRQQARAQIYLRLSNSKLQMRTIGRPSASRAMWPDLSSDSSR